MTSFENGSIDGTAGGLGVNRRTVLKSAAVVAAGTGVLSGTASASTFQFFGCSQVCAGTDHDYAVVWTGDDYECLEFDRDNDSGQVSDRNNIDWHSAPMCIEIEEGEAIVGVLKHQANGTTTCKFCPNPNCCARNYYDSVEDLVDELECDGCDEIVEAVECNVKNSSGGRGRNGPNEPGPARNRR